MCPIDADDLIDLITQTTDTITDMKKLKPGGKILLILLVLGGVFAAKVFWWDQRPRDAKESTEIGRVTLPDAPEASLATNAPMLPLPTGTKPSDNGGTRVQWYIFPWNSQLPLMYANGAASTVKGSLIDNAKLQVNLIRQDDCMKSIAMVAAFAEAYKKDPSTPGVFASFMGDGMPAFFAGLCKTLEPLGPEYQPVAFYAMGKSYGEDALMGPPSWKSDPRQAIGKCVSEVLRDGDMNIHLKWAGDNGLKVNPDETTYDPEAMNIIAANDFLDAAQKYIAGYTETRKLVVNGKVTNRDTVVGVDAVATWTPGDVNVAQNKGGLVRIASTKEYSSQMPNITITIRKWLNDHRMDVENLIVALAQAGDQVRSYTAAKQYACEVSARVYNEQTPAYWLKYANGVRERDAAGQMVDLGGSMSFNLADAANTFGLGRDGVDRYKAVYTTFGDILSRMYPEYMATYPDYQKVVDKSVLATVISNHPELLQGQALKVEYAETITEAVGDRSYDIHFETGSATVKPESYAVLDEILKSAIVAEGLKVGVYGHTDDVGNDAMNQQLSESRAVSVRAYLLQNGLRGDRVESRGYGESQPLVPNTSATNRAQNRRVQIVLGN
jgi:outer membrane protein OmpA-like peptidoglycan-associated protein